MPLAIGELARFEREAKVLAASAYFNIAGLEDRASPAFRSALTGASGDRLGTVERCCP